MAIASYADKYKEYLANKDNPKKNAGTARNYSVNSSDPTADIVLGTLFMNPARIARGVASATGKETSEGAKKALGWASMPGAKVEQGFFGAAEGITDFLAGGAAQIAGQKDAAKWIYEHSWSRDAVGADVTDEYVGDAAESKGYQLASDLLSGVGNVGFQVAVGTLIGGALAAPVANGAISQAGARAISFAPLFASASGAGTAENIAKTGELGWRENVGGLLKGGVEVLTEVISPTGKIVDRAINGKSAGSIFRYLSKHAVAKNIIVDFASEAGEEMASYAGGWFIENKLKISDEAFSARDMVYQGVLGGITGAIFAAPSDISLVRSARSAGAKVYAQGDAAVKNKINEGLIEVKLLKERGLNNDNVKLAEAALAKLTTDENLSQTTKEYYLGLAEQMVLKQNLSDKYNALAKDLVAKAKADPATAQSMADAFNALVNEAGGEGKYTAADFTNENSEAARIYVVAQMANDWLSPSLGENTVNAIMNDRGEEYTGEEQQKEAVRNLKDGEVLNYKIGQNAYAIITKQGGTNNYSIAYTTTEQMMNGSGEVMPVHKLSADDILGSGLDGSVMTNEAINTYIDAQREQKAAQEKERAKKAAEKVEKNKGKKDEKPSRSPAKTKKAERAEQRAKAKQAKIDAESAVDRIVKKHFAFDEGGQYGTLGDKAKGVVADFMQKLKTAKAEYRDGIALSIADYLIDNVDMLDAMADGVSNEQREQLQILRSYMHRIDLSGLQAEIRHHFDKNNGINAVWGAPKGAKSVAVPPDTLGMELAEYGIQLQGENEADLFIQLVEKYRSLRDAVSEKAQRQSVRDGLSAEELSKLRNTIADEVKAAVGIESAPADVSLSPSEETTAETTGSEETPGTEETEAKEATIEDLTSVEKRLTPDLGVDSSDFTKEEWAKARECVPNIDGLTRRGQARVLTLVRTAQANGINENYMKGLARLSSVYGFGVMFNSQIRSNGMAIRSDGMVIINPQGENATIGHEIWHTIDQTSKDGQTVFRADLVEKVRTLVGVKQFDAAKAEYKRAYEAQFKKAISDAELDGEATASVVGKYLSNMTLLKKIAATDYSLGRGLLAAIRRMKDKWTSAKAFAKENDSTAFAEYRKMTRIEKLLTDELKNRKNADIEALRKAVENAEKEGKKKEDVSDDTVISTWEEVKEEAEEESVLQPEPFTQDPTPVQTETEQATEEKVEITQDQTDEAAQEEAKPSEQSEKPKEKTPRKRTAGKKVTANENVTTETAKISDFGEKIGGARKDEWIARGLNLSDLDNMNEAEKDKYSTKDYIWRRPNYQQLIEGGQDRVALFAQNELRKAVNPRINYRSNMTAEAKEAYRNLYVSTVAEIRDMVSTCRTKEDFERIIKDYVIGKGYFSIQYGHVVFSNKFHSNPAFGYSFVDELTRITQKWDNLANRADKAGFGLDASKKVPAGFGIDKAKDGTYEVVQGGWRIVQRGFATYEDALTAIQNAVKRKKTKTRFVPAQLLEVHRTGYNYRNARNVEGQDYLDTFGFRGGEFGNWMSEKDRQVSMNYGYDALRDLADALGIDYRSISLGGNLAIAFGARGQGLSGAAAHYEPLRNVINLTKMNGAGSLGHEWWHALDKYLAEENANSAIESSSVKNPEVKTALVELSNAMKYREATQQEIDARKQHQREKYERWLSMYLEQEFKWAKIMKDGEQDTKFKYERFERTPNDKDLARYDDIKERLLKGDASAVGDLNALHKETYGYVITKDTRDQIRNLSMYFMNIGEGETVRATATTTSQFYKDAQLLDNIYNKDGGYWSSREEMAARAFAVYVFDKINNQSFRDDYLVGHAFAASVIVDDKGTVAYGYPRGEDRVRINEAFDNLFRVIKEQGILKEQAQATKPELVSYSPAPVTPETDSRYLSLARDPQKNESELRRLVKEAAEKAGFDSPLLYHGTDYYGKITVFRKGKTGYLGGGIYFTDSETNAKRYAEKMGAGTVYSAYLQVKNPLRVSSAYPAKEILFAAYGSDRTYNARVQDQGNAAHLVQPKDIKKLQSLGYDGIVWKLAKGTETEYSVFEPSQVKSADLVTYDDSGNIITLSERFNPQNDDIRYSPAPSGSGRIVIQASQSRPTGREKLTNLKGELSRSNFRAALESLQVIAVNAQQGVENQLVRAGMTKREAAAFSQLARSGRSHAINAICYKLADMTGKIRSEGLIPILEPFLATKGEVYPAVDKDGNTVQSTAKGGELAGKRYSDFSDYYAMLHAIDRAAVGKNPYSSMTVAQMKQIVAEYEQKNPDFKAAAEKLSAFNSAMLDIEVQAGIISQKTADEWRTKYPHYVPMYTQDSNAVGGNPVRGARNMEVRRDNAVASESDHRVSDPIRNYIDQVQRRIRAAKLNILLNEVYNSADGVNVVTAEADRAEAKDLRKREQAYLENPESENDPAEMFRKFKRGKNTVNEVSFYKDGKRVTMAVTDRIYTGLSDLGGIHSSILDSWTVKAVKKVNDTFKKLVTNWNPFFAVKNIARDLQDGTLQSRFGMGEYLNMYRKNAEMMATGKYNDMWEEFLANGGLESSLYSDEFGTFTKGGKSGLEQATGVVGQFQHIKNFNTLTEALPRFTEYCLTRKHGGSVQTALLNAADVTVNFGRSGTLIRILNSTVSPFLNPAVQGLDRVIRLFTEDGIKNNKALASLILKAVLLAIVPMALGNAMYGNDDEYKDMKDSIKENNYLFKVGDTWLKLPRGRVVSTVSGLFNRSYKQLTGQDTDWGDYGKNVLDQITPAQNVARHIFSPFADVANNRTWYGTKIESDALQNYAVNQRYDENTSRISVWIGQLTSHFGLSPKEVNYLIDQYTGVVGDILLPTTTPAGTKGVVSYNFTVDPNTSSNLSNRFYDLYNKTMYKSNDGDVEAYYLKKRLDETKSAVSELFKQIKTINASSELSNKEKVKQASAIRASINQLYKTALDDRRLYEQNVKDALAIENSYAIEKITTQSAKRYGLDSDAVGKYALTFGGDYVKQYDTEAQANEYKADASKKTVYAEANRLTYGAEYALKEYSSTVYDKAATLNELGIDWEDYYSYYMTVRYYSGKTKKDKILAYLNGSGLSKSQIALMMYYSGYSAYANEAKKAIKASSLSAERKKELLAGITN